MSDQPEHHYSRATVVLYYFNTTSIRPGVAHSILLINFLSFTTLLHSQLKPPTMRFTLVTILART